MTTNPQFDNVKSTSARLSTHKESQGLAFREKVKPLDIKILDMRARGRYQDEILDETGLTATGLNSRLFRLRRLARTFGISIPTVCKPPRGKRKK